MGVLSESLRKQDSFRKIVKCMEDNGYPVAVTGCVDSQKGHLVSNLAEIADAG